MGRFSKATKAQSRLRMALIGPAGSGKTMSALAIAANLVPGGRVAVLDTEHGSASKYADKFDFDVDEMTTFDPRAYIEGIQTAEAEGYDVLVIDSLSHEWIGRGGALEMVDQAAARSRSGNTFTAWKEVTPLHNALIEAIVQCRCHLICTMRSKVDYVLEQNYQGKMEPKKVGMAPVQREGMDFEFDVVGDLDRDHRLIISKTRCEALDRAVIEKPGKQVADTLRVWLSDGAPAAEVPKATTCPPDLAARLHAAFADAEVPEINRRAALAKRGVSRVEDLAEGDARELIGKIEAMVSKFPFETDPKIAGDGTDEAPHDGGDPATATDGSGSDADDAALATADA